jgi:beta-barrel assembly-enhancing protease
MYMAPQDFTGIFFDGNASGPIPVRVALTPSALVITYHQQGTLPVTQYWQAHRIEQEADGDTGKTMLRYGQHPALSLQVDDPAFLPLLASYYHQAPPVHQNGPLQAGKSPRWIWPLALLVLALIPATFFWAVPAVADFAARRVPASYERLLGRQLEQQLVNRRQVMPDQTRQLRHFARQLRLQAPYPLEMTVIDHPEPNAFAIPGGYIVVHNSMLEKVKSPEELAALLGHEYGHLQLRHTTRTLFRNLSGYLFVSLLLGDVSGVTAVVLNNAQSLRSLQYSRELEKEADRLGLQVLLQNGLDPGGMVRLFERLKAQSKESEAEFISSHPLLRSRIREVQALIKKQRPTLRPNDSLQYYWKQIKAPAR